MDLRRILHAEDDYDVRALVRLSLETIGGFELRQCHDGASTVAATAEFNPDLLLLDYMMPDLNGEETWRQITGIPGFETVPTVFLTAKSDYRLRDRLLREGAAGFISKPFETVTLPDEIRGIWRAQQTGTARPARRPPHAGRLDTGST